MAVSTSDQSLRGYLARLEADGQLVDIRDRVDIDGQLAACLCLCDEGPALRFSNVSGHEMPVVGNIMTSRMRIATAFGLLPDQLDDHLESAVAEPILPKPADGPAPCQQLVTEPDLAALPIPRFFEHETGPYVTAGVIVARDLETGQGNLSIARLMPLSGNRAFVGIAPNHHLAVMARRAADLGERLPLAVTIGNHPAVMLASTLYLGFGTDEMGSAGGLIGEPIRTAETATGKLQVPADCEIVLEGYLDPAETVTEGLVSEYHGMYEDYGDGYVATFDRITRREDAFLQVVLPGFFDEHVMLGAVSIAAGLRRHLRSSIPVVSRVAVPFSAAGRLAAVVSVKSPRAGDAKRVILAGLSAVTLIKQVVVVDDDIDPWDERAVAWAIHTRARMERDMVVTEGQRTDRSEPIEQEGLVCKWGIDATKKTSDRPDWRRAMPDQTAMETAKTLLNRLGLA
ncbi:MAG: UbiD family decarboxylase [Rhodospirillales bacterium]|nr:UbiD family decarboxylase [Rhodospirillales bacterium]